MALYAVAEKRRKIPKNNIVWIKSGHKHTIADLKKHEDFYWQIAVCDEFDDEDNWNSVVFVGGETDKGWFRIPAKEWKTKRTPISYNNSTKVIKFMGFNGKYYSFKLKPTAFTKAKKIIDSYNKKWDAKKLNKKKTPAKKKTTTKRKASPVRKKLSQRKKAPKKSARILRGKRNSPSTSATSVSVGTKRRGGDGKMYVCKTYKRGNKRVKRWFKV